MSRAIDRRVRIFDYLNFDVQVGAPSQGAYPIRGRSPAGEPRGTFRLPYPEDALAGHLAALAALRRRPKTGARDIVDTSRPATPRSTVDTRLPESFGRAFFDALLGGELSNAYRLSRDRATREGKGLRVRLSFDTPELAALPWELMYDDLEHDFLALSAKTPVVRYLELDRPPEPVPVARPIRILGMIALPSDVPQLDAGQERSRIERELAALIASKKVYLQWVEGQTWRDLQRAAREAPWNIFHFVGHGSAEIDGGSIILADDEGRSAPLAAEELGRLLAGQSALGLVVLNACEGAQGSGRDLFSSSAATLVQRGLPAVVAMQHEVSDTGAITFARDFYGAVAESLPVDAALAEARIALSLACRDSAEWATPVLMMRAPDGRLFALDPAESLEAATSETPVPHASPDEFPELPGSSTRGWLAVLALMALAVVAYIVFLIAGSQ